MSNDPVTQLDDQQRKVLPRIEALLRLYDKGKHSEEAHVLNEAESALAKAQELLLAYNLSADLVGTGSNDGVREEQKLKGGFRQYERDLWQEVAELNFCMYFSSGETVVTAYKRTRPDGSKYIERDEKFQYLHRLVGRKVNVMATVNMARYLEDAIERLVDERLVQDSAGQRWSKFNIAFREGAASTITHKLFMRRRQLVAEEEAKQREAAERAQQAGSAGVSTGTALTISSHTQAEKDANNDHANGWQAGKTASLRAEWQAKQAAQAEANRIAREEHTRWCEENPEEARKLAEARRKEEEAAEKREARNAARRTGGRYRGWTAADERREAADAAYTMGRRAAEKINIDQQMGAGGKGGSLGNG